ncbi:MAG: sulfite exporter TauE/SafE family protein, partial [Kiritimatiellia bacterium]
MDVITFCGAAIIATIVGALTGIFGVGGGFLITPALIIILGIDPTLAVGTGLTFMLFPSSISMFRRRGSKTVDLKLSLYICVGTLAGVVFGKHIMTLLETLPPFRFGVRELPAVEYSLLWAFLGLLIFIAWFLIYDYRRTGGQSSGYRVGWLSRVHLPPMVNFPSLDEPRLSLPVLTFIGFFIGILTGLM